MHAVGLPQTAVMRMYIVGLWTERLTPDCLERAAARHLPLQDDCCGLYLYIKACQALQSSLFLEHLLQVYGQAQWLTSWQLSSTDLELYKQAGRQAMP